MTDREQEAADSYETLQAYVTAGFTREEAMQVLCRPHVTIAQAPVKYPPEMYEFWGRQNALATKMIVEMDDET